MKILPLSAEKAAGNTRFGPFNISIIPLTPIYAHAIPSNPMLGNARRRARANRMEGGVTAFMSTINSKIDAKGRVSVPSVFRSAIAAQNGDVASPHGIFVYPSFTENAIEGGGQSR